MRNTILILLFLCFSSLYVNGQQMTTKGKDFWLGFMNNGDNMGFSPLLFVYITSTQNTSGTVSIPGLSWNQTFTVLANTTTSITIPNNAMVQSTSIVENKGIHVTTADTVSVFALNYKMASADACNIFPTQTLDREYRVLAYDELSLWSKEEFLIVAIDNNSVIEITPYLGIPFTINLNEGQTYQYISNNASGTIIKVTNINHKIAVFTGNKCTNVGGCQACDHLFEQLLPVNRFGRNFITVPFMTKSQDYFRIIAHANNTAVTINGGTPIVLQAGQFHQFNTGQSTFIQSTEPVFVLQFAQGAGCDTIGDPFAVIVPPIEQSIDDITFYSPVLSFFDHYVNIVTLTAHTTSLTLGGFPVSFTPVSNNPLYSYAREWILTGNHRIISPYGFLATVYCFGDGYESYGYSAGFSMKNLQLFNFIVNGTCIGQPTTFTTQSYFNITNYQWLFGDGTTGTGLITNHTYLNAGTYTVGLILSGVNSIDTIFKTIQISPVIFTNQNFTICQGDSVIVGTHYYTAGGTYSDTLATFLGCDSIVTTHLIVNPIKQTLLNPVICQGEIFTVGIHNYTISGIYFDTLKTFLGCDSIITTNLNVKSLPIFDLGSDTTICKYTSFILNATTANATYMWQDNSTNPTYNVTLQGLYWVIATINNCSSSDSINIIIEDCEALLEMPNIITPNDDGINDVFTPIKTKKIKKMNTLIYNRWGNLIYETDNLNIEWNGKHNDKNVSDGVYYWVVNYTSFSGNEKTMTGSLTIMN